MFEKQRLNCVKSAILRSYKSSKLSRSRDGGRIPNRNDVEPLLESIISVLYPDYYFDCKNEHSIEIESHISNIINKIYGRLSLLIQACIGTDKKNLRNQQQKNTGNQLCLKFLEHIPALQEKLQCDVHAALDGDPAAQSIEEVILCYPGLYAVTVYRIAHELHSLAIPLLPRIMTELAHQRTGIDIHPGASIGRYFFIDHGTGVVIGETAVIDDNVKLYQGVTLGALSFPKDQYGNFIGKSNRHPKIGKGVTIYANATILGGDTYIGDHCVIGSSAFITKSVDAFHTAKIAKSDLRICHNPLISVESENGLQTAN